MSRQRQKTSVTRERRLQIMDAAFSVFSRKGFERATIPEIAEAAGISVGTIYNYYQNKRDLLVSMVGSYVMTERVAALLKGTPSEDETLFLSSIIESRLDISSSNADKLISLIGEIYRDPKLRKRYCERILYPMLKLMQGYVESKVAAGAFRPVDSGICARTLVSTGLGLSILGRLEGENSPLTGRQRKKALAVVVRIVLDGVRSG